MWTEFADTLPASLDSAERGHPDPNAGQRATPSILLLDDDPFMLGIQARMLRSMGYPMIGTAGDADEALIRLRDEPQAADVVICDLNMPGMDGIEFLQKLAASPFHGNVILLSGEGVRIMHTVQKLIGGRLVILGALEKPASRASLRALLDCWHPVATEVPALVTHFFSADELHTANAARQWVLHFQPKVALASGALVGVEALVRWNHPQQGLVYPDRFIGIAEDCGAINALTDWVLQAAIDQQARWRGDGLRVHMAVNVSMENLRSAGFAHRVRAMVNASCSSPQDLVLEITESRLIAASPAPLESLVRLRMQRFGLAIDDFGTGHSSLAQLRDVPFTELKVDRGFVHAARHNQITRPILEGSIGIARRLGMLSVAEGVETEDDWYLLREIGCDLAQGYFIGRPMSGERLPAWYAEWQARCGLLVHP